MKFELVYNLDDDFKNIMLSKLESLGIKRVGSDEDIEMTLLNAARKQIETRARQVLLSDVLQNCPDSLKADLEAVLLKAQKGEDLSPYLPKDAKKWDYLDGLLNDWGIHHLHFFPKEARSQDSDYLLFARVTPDKFYAIAVTAHRKWTDPELIEILKRNWPETVHVINQGAVTEEQKTKIRQLNLQQKRTPQEYAQLRNAGIMSLVVTDDGSLIMPTLGINSKKHANEDALLSLQLERTLKFLKEIVPKELPGLLQKICTLPPTGSIRLKMVDIDTTFAVLLIEDGNALRLSWLQHGSEYRLAAEVFPNI